MKKKYTASLLGVGYRGGKTYAEYFKDNPDFSVECVCDVSKQRLDEYGDKLNIKKENRFLSDDEFFKEKRSDALIVATPEKTHMRIAKKAIELGYHVLLEIPVSDNPDELRELVALKANYPKIVKIAYILRYDSMIRKIKELISSGEIGKLVSIDYTENVVYWHQAHSFVRGNWRNTDRAMPMILLKCCHDLDVILYLVGEKCTTVSSLGNLFYFKKENRPKDAAKMCVDCKYADDCTYSAKNIYIRQWKNLGSPASVAPMNIITDEYPLTEKALSEAIKTSDYGRCVFDMDNNVVDNQTVIMQFENNATATLKMEAFVKDGGRDIRIFGTEGEIELRERDDSLVLRRFSGADEKWKISDLGHSGAYAEADKEMIDDFVNEVKAAEGGENIASGNSDFIESHFIAMGAEESRLGNGKAVDLFKFRTGSGLEKNMLGYIDSHFNEKLTIAAVAKEMGYTVGYCSKVLKRATGKSFNDYLNGIRIAKVDEKLSDKTTKSTLQEILYECGFEYSSTYYRSKEKLKKVKDK